MVNGAAGSNSFQQKVEQPNAFWVLKEQYSNSKTSFGSFTLYTPKIAIDIGKVSIEIAGWEKRLADHDFFMAVIEFD